MEPQIRELTDADRETNHRLGAEAFGYPQDQQPATLPPQGGRVFGALVEGVPVAKIRLHDYDVHLPGGRRIAACGIAGVAVQPEWRGSGLLTPLLRTGLRDAQEAGRPISILFPSAAGIYRRFGYEVVGSLEQRRVASADLARIPAPQGITLRRATPADIPALLRLYGEWAADRLGPLTRTGPAEPMLTADYLTGAAEVTLALDVAGRPVGSVRWTRGVGDDAATSVIEVDDLIGVSPEATRALWRLLGGFASTSGRITVELPSGDEALTALPVEPAPSVHEHRCMLALLDVSAAFGARRGIPGLAATLPFRVEGGFAKGVDGGYELVAQGGELRCSTTTSADGPVFTARGLAALYGGAQRCSALRHAGLLHGPAGDDPVWDALCSTPFQICDYF
ncbi:GNAT family N-acetyltransferase [Flexivirga caeni]|uniref:GNAT family N-acetyltransferase n=1 Tax=Flexivirga caeni TaxID=2294115 RepID=A0A3M9MAP4_9MICO|nr:GNAT family N-acetyltransferase [Flexivirga caeni]RNI21618.1 GNAT family N-acetyltransferase [Flexivirga caeni]